MTHAKILLLIGRIKVGLDKIEKCSERKDARGLDLAVREVVHEFCNDDEDPVNDRLKQIRSECSHEMEPRSTGEYNEDVCRKCGKSEWL